MGRAMERRTKEAPLEKKRPESKAGITGETSPYYGPKRPVLRDRCTPKCETVAKHLRHRWPYYGGKSPVLRDEINHRGTKIRRSMPHEPWNSERFMDFLISKGVNPNTTA